MQYNVWLNINLLNFLIRKYLSIFVLTVFYDTRLNISSRFHNLKTIILILFLFLYLWISLIAAEDFISLRSGFLSNYPSSFVILDGFWSTKFKCLTKHHFKHSFSSMIWILIKNFLGSSNYFCNLIQVLPRTSFYFEMLIVWSKTEPLTKPGFFPKYC